MQANVHEKLLSALASAIIVALLGYLLLVGLTIERGVRDEPLMTLLDFHVRRPVEHRPAPHAGHPKRARASGRPANLGKRAVAIVIPPLIVLPPMPSLPVPVVKAVATGASDRAGPGEGAGGQGSGAGGGGSGDGDDGGGGDVPPRRIRGRLSYADLPAELRDGGIGGTVSVRYDVDVDGEARDCEVTASSGSVLLDRLTCQLIEQRFRFNPSRDGQGRSVRSTIEENHIWEIDRDHDPGSHP